MRPFVVFGGPSAESGLPWLVKKKNKKKRRPARRRPGRAARKVVEGKRGVKGQHDAHKELVQRRPEGERGRHNPASQFLVVGMGASAGGLEALEKFFNNAPADAPMAFVLVTHLDPRHASMMTELIGRHTAMPVKQAEDGMRLAPSRVYIIPPNATLTLERGALRVGPLEKGPVPRMLIDRFFASLAMDQGENAVCIVLSGSGTDGTIGLKSVKEHGGLTIAQQPESAKYDSMPPSASPTGLVDFVLPVEQMPARLLEYSRALRGILERRDGGGLDAEVHDALPRIVAAVRRRTGHDFSEYRPKTIIRRVQRRMQVLYLDTDRKSVV